jgi:hypothetical protein
MRFKSKEKEYACPNLERDKMYRGSRYSTLVRAESTIVIEPLFEYLQLRSASYRSTVLRTAVGMLTFTPSRIITPKGLNKNEQ